MTNEAASSRVVAQSATRWLVVSIYVLLAAASAAGLLLAEHRAWTIALLLIVVVVFAVLAIRAWRSSIVVDSCGITARADRFTKRLLWSDIERFEIRTSTLSGALGAWRVDGSWVRLLDQGYDSCERYEAAVRELQRELQERREA